MSRCPSDDRLFDELREHAAGQNDVELELHRPTDGDVEATNLAKNWSWRARQVDRRTISYTPIVLRASPHTRRLYCNKVGVDHARVNLPGPARAHLEFR